MQQYIEIKSDAIFIADSHHIKGQNELLDLFASLLKSPRKQIFLMGDIFHLFLGHLHSSQKEYDLIIKLINELSCKSEIFYFEGNHDFGIDQNLMPKVKIYPRILQPVFFKFQNKIYALAHGDIFLDKFYEIYINTLNNSFSLSLFKIIDILSLGIIYKIISKKIYKKPIKNFSLSELDFEIFAKKRYELYSNFAKKRYGIEINGVIEGHFHIGKNNSKYFSLPSFYCEKRFFIIQS